MIHPHRPVAAAVLAAALALCAGRASATHISISMDHDEEIRVDGDVVVITADDDREARISPDGGLRVEGRRIPVGAADRAALRRYNEGVRFIEERAVEIGMQGAGLAVSAIGEAVAAIFSGDEKGAERRIEHRAERLKDAARELCEEAWTLQDLQEDLAASLPEFRPFAVLDLDDDDCEVDD